VPLADEHDDRETKRTDDNGIVSRIKNVFTRTRSRRHREIGHQRPAAVSVFWTRKRWRDVWL